MIAIYKALVTPWACCSFNPANSVHPGRGWYHKGVSLLTHVHQVAQRNSEAGTAASQLLSFPRPYCSVDLDSRHFIRLFQLHEVTVSPLLQTIEDPCSISPTLQPASYFPNLVSSPRLLKKHSSSLCTVLIKTWTTVPSISPWKNTVNNCQLDFTLLVTSLGALQSNQFLQTPYHLLSPHLII